MRKTIQLITMLAIIFVMSSFTPTKTEAHIGTFGVSPSNPAQITLIINPDHTFYYQDFSVPDKKIVVNGSWTMRGKKVILQGDSTIYTFHHIWTFTENGQVAKSRKGLCYYRLNKIDS